MSITKAWTSTTTANENKELSLDIFEWVENTTENRKNFLEISSDELKSLQAKAISDQNYEVAAIIRDVLKEKDSHEQESKNAEFKEELNTAKEEDREQNEKQIANLKQQLMSWNIDEATLKKTLNELIRSFEENEKRNREANSKLLEDIKKAKNSWNEQELKRLRWIIKNLALEKKALKDKFAGELPEYDSAEIAKLKTKRIGFKLAWKRN